MSVKPIVELFTSIQGEGQRTGSPSIFIRTTGCNLKCVWCDTPYTSIKPEKGIYTWEDALSYVNTSKVSDVVITGGEPLLWQKDGLIDFCRKCTSKGIFVTIETNGTIPIDPLMSYIVDLFSVSPKLSNSKEPFEKRFNGDFWECLKVLNFDYQIKFVISSEDDIYEAGAFLKEIMAVQPSDLGPLMRLKLLKMKTWFMPLGKTEEELKSRREWLVQQCIEEGVRYCERLHVVIWGDKRGV